MHRAGLHRSRTSSIRWSAKHILKELSVVFDKDEISALLQILERASPPEHSKDSKDAAYPIGIGDPALVFCRPICSSHCPSTMTSCHQVQQHRLQELQPVPSRNPAFACFVRNWSAQRVNAALGQRASVTGISKVLSHSGTVFDDTSSQHIVHYGERRIHHIRTIPHKAL